MTENRSNSALFKRADQLKRWEESDTFQEPSFLKRKKSRISFPDACVFLAACSAGDKDEVRFLLEKGVDINISNIDGLTALSQACIDDNLEMVEFLVEMGADLNRSDNEGWTPLHATVSCGFISIARFLLDNGADLTAVNFDGELAIDICDTDEMLQLLRREVTSRGIDCDACRSEEEGSLLADARRWLADGRITEVPHPKTGAISIHVAAAKGYVQALSLLLKAGVDINAQDSDGWTALHAAAYWGERESCRMLCDNFCNMELSNFQGQTARDVADSSVDSLLETLKKKQLTLIKQRPELAHIINRRPIKTTRTSNSSPNDNDTVGPVSTDSAAPQSEQRNNRQTKTADTPPVTVSTSNKPSGVVMTTAVTSSKPTATTAKTTVAPSIPSVPAKTITAAAALARESSVTGTVSEITDKSGNVKPPAVGNDSKVSATPAEQSASATVVLSSSGSSAPSGSPSSPTSQRRSVLPPSRDDESETRRRAHAKRVRETRRSTQGVTLEELKSAEQYVKNQLQQQQQQKLGSSTTVSGTVVTNAPHSSINTTTTTVITPSPSSATASSSPLSSAALSSSASTGSSSPSRDLGHATSVPTSAAQTTSTISSSSTSSSTTPGLLDRRPSWRLRLDQNNKSKFCLEEVRTPPAATVNTTGGGDTSTTCSQRLAQRSASLTLPTTTAGASIGTDTPTVTLPLPRRASASAANLSGINLTPPSAASRRGSDSSLSSSDRGRAVSDVSVTSASTVSSVSSAAVDQGRGGRASRKDGGGGESGAQSVESRDVANRSGSAQNHVAGGQPQETDEDKENESRCQQVASNVAIQRRRKAKRRSTGVVNVLIEEIEKDKEESARDSSTGNESSSKTLNRSVSGDVSGSDDTLSVRVESKSAGISSGNSALNGDVDYKKLYEEAMVENDRLRVQLNSVEEEFRETKRHAEKSVQLANSRVAAVESEQRENRALERKLAEMEEDLKVMEELRTDNRRLLDENGALIRVISKLSK